MRPAKTCAQPLYCYRLCCCLTLLQETIKLVPHRELILEDCIAYATSRAPAISVADVVSLCCACRYIADDELVEVTPKIVRLRKKKLDPTERKKLSRQAL